MTLDAPVPLSVLDLAPVPEGSTPADSLPRSLDLARRAEALGYGRYWFAEHHNMPGIASAAPAVLIAHVAAGTSTIRVGSGGVMLSNHAPLVIAEQFGTLESLHPGRIDLGLGRAPGTDRLAMQALRRTGGSDDFPSELGELIAYFDGRVDGVRATPGEGAQPALWLLGSSGFSAQLAGYLGLPFAFAHHFSWRSTLPALALYREAFRPSATLERPYAMVCTGVVCQPTEEEARRVFASTRLSIARLHRGRPGRLPSPDEAAAYAFSPHEDASLEEHLGGYSVGDPEQVRTSLESLLAATEADELMITSSAFHHDDRVRSFELIAGLWRTADVRG